MSILPQLKEMIYYVRKDFFYKCMCSVAQWGLTLHDRTDCSPPGSSVHGLLQARILEWVAISFSTGYGKIKEFG